MYPSSILFVAAALLAFSHLPGSISAPIPQLFTMGLGDILAAVSMPANTDLPTTLSEGILPTSLVQIPELIPTMVHGQDIPVVFRTATITGNLPQPTPDFF